MLYIRYSGTDQQEQGRFAKSHRADGVWLAMVQSARKWPANCAIHEETRSAFQLNASGLCVKDGQDGEDHLGRVDELPKTRPGETQMFIRVNTVRKNGGREDALPRWVQGCSSTASKTSALRRLETGAKRRYGQCRKHENGS